MNPEVNFQTLFVHLVVCPITHLLLYEFQQTCFSTSKTIECICERLLHYGLMVAIILISFKSFALNFRCTIYIDISICTD